MAVNDGWRIRRNFMFTVSAFCMVTIVHSLATGADTKVAETAVSMAFLCLTGIVSSYVFGAAWDDINARKGKCPHFEERIARSPL